MTQARSRRAAVFALLALLTLAALGPVAGNGFVNYDDDHYVYANPHVRAGLSAAGAAWALTAFEQSNWHPVTWISHMADVSLFGLEPAGHHLVGLLLHLAAALLLLAFLERATGELWRAAFVASLFALHPLHVESVAWAAERKDVLAGVFWMATLALWLRYLRRPQPGRYLIVICMLALGLAAKPTLVTLPVVLLLLDFWPLGRWRPGGAWPLLREKTPLLVLSLASGAVTLVAQARGGALKTVVEYPLAIRLGNALLSSVTYLAQTLWPRGLAVFYPHPGAGIDVMGAAAAAALLAATTWLLVRHSQRHPQAAVGWLWYLLTLAPVAGLVQVGAQSRADRYTYLPLVGIFMLAAWGVPAIVPPVRMRRAAIAAAAALALATSVAATRIQARVWKDSITLFQHALGVTRGNFVAHDNLSVALADAGRKREALRHSFEALKLVPDRPERYVSLALEFSREGMEAGALDVLALAVARAPGFAEGHHALGLALARSRRPREALAHLVAAVRLAPGSARYRADLEALQQRLRDGAE